MGEDYGCLFFWKLLCLIRIFKVLILKLLGRLYNFYFNYCMILLLWYIIVFFVFIWMLYKLVFINIRYVEIIKDLEVGYEDYWMFFEEN